MTKQVFSSKYLVNGLAIAALSFPFLVPYGLPARDIDLKAWVLWTLGALAYGVLLSSPGYLTRLWSHHRALVWLLAIMAASLLLSTAVAIMPATALYGSPAYRGGLLSELSCIAIGLVLAPRLDARALRWFWCAMVALATCSMALDLPYLVEGARLIGLVYQSNVLAVLLACGLIIGASDLAPRSVLWRWAGQFSILAALILTQSRGLLVLGLLIAAGLMMYQGRRHLRGATRRLALIGAVTGLLVGASVAIGLAGRLVDPGNLRDSIIYRAELQEQGLKLLTVPRPLGWGTDCIGFVYDRYFALPPLIAITYKTAHMVVDSTHNIYLDHILEWGWLGGLAFIGLSGLALRSGWVAVREAGDPITLVLLAVALLLIAQNLFNVTMLEQELVFWIVIIGLIAPLRMFQFSPGSEAPKPVHT